jgi:hypothetical protein
MQNINIIGVIIPSFLALGTFVGLKCPSKVPTVLLAKRSSTLVCFIPPPNA